MTLERVNILVKICAKISSFEYELNKADKYEWIKIKKENNELNTEKNNI